MIKILSRWDSSKVVYDSSHETMRDTVIEAVRLGANLSGADLRIADLRSANLSGANLSDANLSDADLYRANLTGADLSNANLSGATLIRADLSSANLSDANLIRADLSGAILRGADLSGANLSGADLSNANLTGSVVYSTMEESMNDAENIERTLPVDPNRRTGRTQRMLEAAHELAMKGQRVAVLFGTRTQRIDALNRGIVRPRYDRGEVHLIYVRIAERVAPGRVYDQIFVDHAARETAPSSDEFSAAFAALEARLAPWVETPSIQVFARKYPITIVTRFKVPDGVSEARMQKALRDRIACVTEGVEVLGITTPEALEAYEANTLRIKVRQGRATPEEIAQHDADREAEARRFQAEGRMKRPTLAIDPGRPVGIVQFVSGRPSCPLPAPAAPRTIHSCARCHEPNEYQDAPFTCFRCRG